MTPAFLQSILVATTGMVSVGSILIVILLLSAENGFRKASCYVLGYVMTYAVIGCFIVAIGSQKPTTLPPVIAFAIPTIKIFIGAVFIYSGGRSLFGDNHSIGPKVTALLKHRKVTLVRIFAVGCLASLINIKNLVIFIYAISLIAVSRPNDPLTGVYVVIITSVFCSTVILPVLATALAPNATRIALAQVRARLERHGRLTSTLILGCFGGLFVAQGAMGLVWIF
jgi:threonine/homoserine/homoserine lactone efflux protein